MVKYLLLMSYLNIGVKCTAVHLHSIVFAQTFYSEKTKKPGCSRAAFYLPILFNTVDTFDVFTCNRIAAVDIDR